MSINQLLNPKTPENIQLKSKVNKFDKRGNLENKLYIKAAIKVFGHKQSYSIRAIFKFLNLLMLSK